MSESKFQGSARERLLAAADELFYREGVHTVGIDRVIEHAGVAKASLYSAFGSKEELVRAYLQARAEGRQERMTQRVALYEKPRDKILGIFELLGELISQPSFRGCAFVNASAESPRGASKVTEVCVSTRTWAKRLLVDLARDFGAADPERLGQRLSLLYDGVLIAGSMDHNLGAAVEAQSVVELLLDSEKQAHSPKTHSAKGAKRAPATDTRG